MRATDTRKRGGSYLLFPSPKSGMVKRQTMMICGLRGRSPVLVAASEGLPEAQGGFRVEHDVD